MIRYIIYLILLTLSLSAENIRWFSNYDSAHTQALKENKILIVLLIKKESPQSYKMLSTTFMNQDYNKKINSLFVSVLITKGQKETYPIEMLYTLEYPSIFFLDKNELFIGKTLFGYISPDKFNTYLNLYF